jgi:hypothetical protein
MLLFIWSTRLWQECWWVSGPCHARRGLSCRLSTARGLESFAMHKFRWTDQQVRSWDRMRMGPHASTVDQTFLSCNSKTQCFPFIRDSEMRFFLSLLLLHYFQDSDRVISSLWGLFSFRRSSIDWVYTQLLYEYIVLASKQSFWDCVTCVSSYACMNQSVNESISQWINQSMNQIL